LPGAAAFGAVFTDTGIDPAFTPDEPGVTSVVDADGHDTFDGCHAFAFGRPTFLPWTLWTGIGLACLTGGGTALAAAGGAVASRPTREHTASSSGTRSLRAACLLEILRRKGDRLRIAFPVRNLRVKKVLLLI